MSWHFKTHDGFSDIDQSTSSEAFSGGSIRDLATALVREGVQNVLDARSDTAGDQPVHVCFNLSDVKSEGGSGAAQWFEHLDEHLAHDTSGLPEPPDLSETCRTLIIEDFQTRGLTGDYTQPYDEGQQNNFVNFMYHDGVTVKAGKKLGSRGVGKIVFTMASRARTIFAYTIREDDPSRQPLLVGKNLLNFRTMSDGMRYQSRSYFVEDWPEGSARQPVSDPERLATFRETFPLTRADQTGLSIVVPFVDESVDANGLKEAVINEYHYAILAGRLTVDIIDNGEVEHFSADHLPKLNNKTIDGMVDLARWAIHSEEEPVETLSPEAWKVQDLTEELVPDKARQAIGDALDQRKRIAVSIPLFVHPKQGDPVATRLMAYLEYAEKNTSKPEFIRELLPVSDVRQARAVAQVRSLVVIEDEPLVQYLRAAEGANHTDWNPRADKLKRDYILRKGEISYVATAVAKLVDIVRGQANEPVGGIATRFFSAAVPEKKSKTKGSGKDDETGPDPDEVPDDLEPNPGAAYKLVKNADGFTIKQNPERDRPTRLTVRVAYDVLRGSPWSKNAYDPADFDFRKPRGSVRVTHSGAEVERPDPGNRLIILPAEDEFEIYVHGFDANRDLIVDVRDTTPRPSKDESDASADEEETLNDQDNGKEAEDERATDQLHAPQSADA